MYFPFTAVLKTNTEIQLNVMAFQGEKDTFDRISSHVCKPRLPSNNNILSLTTSMTMTMNERKKRPSAWNFNHLLFPHHHVCPVNSTLKTCHQRILVFEFDSHSCQFHSFQLKRINTTHNTNPDSFDPKQFHLQVLLQNF